MRRNHAYHELNYHLVFVTKNREKWLDRAALEELRESFSEKAKELSLLLHIVNGYEDHVHLLVSVPPTLSIAEVSKFLKGYSSRKLGSKYYWARGYAAFTVDRSSFQRVAIYIEKQEEHHRKGKLNQEEEPPFLNP